jgi:hypothetical protein
MLSEHSDAGFVLEESIFLQFAPPLYTWGGNEMGREQHNWIYVPPPPPTVASNVCSRDGSYLQKWDSRGSKLTSDDKYRTPLLV